MASFRDLPIRSDLRDQEPYGAPQIAVPYQLNVNENTFGIPNPVQQNILERIQRILPTLNRYPDREFIELRSALADYLGYGLTPNQVWAANGSNEILMQLFQAFGGPGATAMSFGPTYSMYPNIARISLTPYLELPREVDFQLSASYVAEAIREHNPRIVILCNPNNPTGTPISTEVIRAAYEAFDGILIVDEAYAEFAEELSALPLLDGRERLVISRTMSKAFAFAGVRLGYMAASEAVVDAVRIVRLPYHLSALTQAAALAALEGKELMLANVEMIKVQRDRIIAELGRLGLRPFNSMANFVLCDGFAKPQQTFSELLEKGVLVRNVGIPNTLRITAGTAAETDYLLETLAKSLG
ncbi:MAG: hypothetical protein RIS08_1096 [Actinomycetota bacterium]